MKKIASAWHMAVFLSSLSVAFGIGREFLIVGLLGFSAINDRLQLYLSIFYTIGLSIDAMRLACLNLYTALSLSRLMLTASVIGLPFCLVITFLMGYAIGELNIALLMVCLLGSYLNLIAALLITWLQRHDCFLPAQVINVLPNLILIPGILFCYLFAETHLMTSIVCLTSLIPVFQCIFLLILAQRRSHGVTANLPLIPSLIIFARHFSAMMGEQLFQIIARTAFYLTGAGFLSVYAMAIRIYSALRFILIDSLIGSKLANWQEIGGSRPYFVRMVNATVFSILMASITLLLAIRTHPDLLVAAIQMVLILLAGFYFATLVRVIYFKINRAGNHPALITQFALYELITASCAFLWSRQIHYSVLALMWMGYVAKPLAQLLLLRREYQQLEMSKEVSS